MCRSNVVLLLAVLLLVTCHSIPRASAREMARVPAAAAAPAAVPATPAEVGLVGVPGQALPVPDAAAKVAASLDSTSPAAQRAREAARQARSAAQGKTVGRLAAPVAGRSKPAVPPAKAAAAAKAPRKTVPASKPAAAATAASAGASSSSPAQAAAPSKVQEGLPPMIPLPLLFGDSKFTNPQLSPDGRYMAYVRPDSSGISNVYLRTLPQRRREATAQERSAAHASGLSIFDREGTKGDRQITFEKNEGVSSYSWSEDGSGILFIQDHNGDENYHLYLTTLAQPGAAVDLTPFPGVKAQDILSSELYPRKLFIGLNKRDASVFDLYALDLDTLALTLHTVNPGDVSTWQLDFEFAVRGAECYNNTNGASYVIINDALPPIPQARLNQHEARLAALRRSRSQGAPTKLRTPLKANTAALEALFAKAEKEKWGLKQWIKASSSQADVSRWRRLLTWPFGEEGGVFKFNKPGDALYVISSLGRDTTELQLLSTAKGAKVLQHIASNPLSNINSVEFHPRTWEPQIVSFDYLKVQWTLLDQSLAQEWARIEGFRPGEEVTIVDRSRDEQVWIIGYTSDSINAKYYIHRRGTWPPESLFDTRPGLAPYSVAKTHPVVITARDGLKLPSYLTLPVKPGVIPEVLPECATGAVPNLSGKGRSRPDAAARRAAAAALKCPLGLDLPMVLYVHGGPWSRDTWGADPVAQLLTNRGYAVLQVNYRASSGYGKRFTNLGDKQWGIGTMQHDLTDSVKWAVEAGIADPKKVCIMGGSYGGYATLAGLAFTPELYACGVDLVGISNIGTFMKSIPPYWEPLRYEWTTRVGPADTDEAFNRARSPMFYVQDIKAPLLIAQGAHDPRVPQAESDQMFAAMLKRGRPVRYVLYTDEGHGISKPLNRIDFYSRVEQFLAEHLGGRAEAPLKLEGVSAIDVRTLADLQAVEDIADKEGEKKPPVALVDATAKERPAAAQQPAKKG